MLRRWFRGKFVRIRVIRCALMALRVSRVGMLLVSLYTYIPYGRVYVYVHPIFECGYKTQLQRQYIRTNSNTANKTPVSFAGLIYLTLWLCSKFSVAFPYLPRYPVEDQRHSDDSSSVRRRGAAPPVYLMLIAFVPTATACFIAASRWFNYRHHGFDILFGAALGIFFAYIGFNMYHIPIRRGAGWAWGARSRGRAFGRGVGFPSSLGTDGWAGERALDVDIEGAAAVRQMGVRGNGQGHAQGQEHVKPVSSEGEAVRLEGE